MFGRFKSLCETAAGDGASSPIGMPPPRNDIDALLNAWYRERQESVECRLCLDQAGRLLRRLMDEAGVPSQLRRQARQLLLTIRAKQEAQRGGMNDPDNDED